MGELSDADSDNKVSGKEKIKGHLRDFDEMIEFMDFSFETAFQQKDNEFMIAYREHIKMIQDELHKLREKSNDTTYADKKKKKLQNLESKLNQIRKQALFLGDMSEMHAKAIKEKKLKVGEEDNEKVFLQEQMIKERNRNMKIR